MKPVNREKDLAMDLAQAALSNRKNTIDLAGPPTILRIFTHIVTKYAPGEE